MSAKIVLGRVKPLQRLGLIQGETLWLTQHEWQCGWYWAFGYIGNKDLHCHFKEFLENNEEASKVFVDPQYTDPDWWVIRDLFKQAYALQAAAEVYRYGGHQTTRKDVTDLIECPVKAKMLNQDLERILDTLWNFLETRRKS